MYGFPSDPKVDVLKGETLIQVCFGSNDLILNFSGDISIGLYASVGFGLDLQAVVRYDDFIEPSNQLLQLLSVEVVAVKWTSNGTLSITFAGGRIVECYDDSPQFECYTIKTPQGIVVV